MPDGILEPDHLYSVAIQLYGLRELPAGGNPHFTTTERLSRSFFDFSTEILQIPDDAPVYLPSVDPSGSPTGDAIYTFHLEVEAGQTVFIDPVVAVGYDYEIGDGDPNFKSVMLPEVGDNKFNLYLFNGANYVFEAIIEAEDLYSFDSDGVDRFRIMGIEASAGLDPNNATAFPTALTFVSDGSFTGTMTPIVVNQVDIDIKPGSYPNCLNMNGHGLITVAVLGSDSLDVSQVDISTLKFAGLDVRVKNNSNPQCSIEDVSGDFTDPAGAPDGYDDLVCHFIDDPSAWSLDNGTATLSGALLDGTQIEGTDTLCIVP